MMVHKLLGAYWQAVQAEIQAIQREETFLPVEMMIHFEAILDEAMTRLYVLGLYDEEGA